MRTGNPLDYGGLVSGYRSGVAVATVGFVVACGGPSATGGRANSSQGEDDWATSALWLHATAGSPSGKQAECKYVAEVLAEEERCQARLCRYGAELATEWLEKCKTIEPSLASKTSELRGTFLEAKAGAATPCATELEGLLGGGCKPETCSAEAQRWATTCGETEAGPLAVRMLQRTVGRYGGEDRVRLDMRSCPTLREELVKASVCGDLDSCREHWPQVKLYRKSCESKEAPPKLLTGVAQMAIAFGAEQTGEVVAVAKEPRLLYAGQYPLTLADGKGAILRLCWKRPADRASYLKMRDECQSGALEVVRVHTKKGGGRELRFGRVHLPTVLPLTTLYPWLRVVDEQLQEDDRALAALRRDLAGVMAAPSSEEAKKLLVLVNTHARFLRRSYEAREALGEEDGKLVFLFEQLAAVKVNNGLRVPSIANRWGLVQRAKKRPFADLGPEATLQLGSFTAAHSLTVQETLPQSMAAYLKRLGPLVVMVERGLKPGAGDVQVAKQFGRRQVEACDAALDRLVELEGELLACAFNLDGCSAEQQYSLGERWGQARDEVEKAHHGLDIALGVVGGIDDSLATEAANAGCTPP